jgi:hypothetical protein
MRYVAPPSQNRTWSVTPSGSQRESFAGLTRAANAAHCVKRASCVVMRIVRSVSGHVSLARYLPPPPLRSTRITRLHRYYERLRLPGPLRPLPRFPSLSEAARSRTPEPGSPWLPHTRYTSSTGSVIPGGLGVLAKTHAALLPAGCLETIGPLQRGHFGTRTFTAVDLPLFHLACFRAYASDALSPTHLQGSIPGLWLAVTRAGLSPARVARHCHAAT